MSEWLPPALVGITFTVLGLLKVYGLSHGIVGGGCKPTNVKLCGSCPSWSRGLNIGFTFILVVIGLGNLAYLLWIVLQS